MVEKHRMLRSYVNRNNLKHNLFSVVLLMVRRVSYTAGESHAVRRKLPSHKLEALPTVV